MRWLTDIPQELVDDVRLRVRVRQEKRRASQLEAFQALMQPIRSAQEAFSAEYPHHCMNCYRRLAQPSHCDKRCEVLGEMGAEQDKEGLWNEGQ